MSGKYRKSKRSNNGGIKFLYIVLIGLFLVVTAVIMLYGSGALNVGETTDPTDAYVESTDEGDDVLTTNVTAPTDDKAESSDGTSLELSDGKLVIDALFQYSGPNPDNNWLEGTNIGAVIIRNVSDEYLEHIDLTVTMSDGVELQFAIADIPAGKEVWAFDLNNTVMDADAQITSVNSKEEFLSGTGLSSDVVQISVEGLDVTLSNVSDGELGRLEVVCRTVLDDAYFGGQSFSYIVDQIPAGGEAYVVAFDCLLGSAEVTLVDYAQ